MSIKNIIKLFSGLRSTDTEPPEVAWIRWRGAGGEQAIKEGVNIIECKLTNSVQYKAYVLCVKNDSLGDDDDGDLTDAEEEITMTPMVYSKVQSNNHLATVIPESDDGEDSDDSVDSIILASQENKRKETSQRKHLNTSQVNQSNTINTMVAEQSSSVHLQLEASTSIHDLETQPVDINDSANILNPQPDKDVKPPLNSVPSIHEVETQDFIDNDARKIYSECRQLPLDSDLYNLPTQLVPVNRCTETSQNPALQIQGTPLSKRLTVESDAKSEDVTASKNQSEEQSHPAQDLTKNPELPASIHEEETQEIFKVPGCRTLTVVAPNNSSKDEGDISSDIRDSQLCDFDGFTEDFEIQASQSLLLDVESVPQLPVFSKLPAIIEDVRLSPECVKDEKDTIEIKQDDELKDEDINKEMADLEDEPTQIITSQELDEHTKALLNKSSNIHEVATQMLPALTKSASFQNDSSPDIYNMATQCILKENDVLNISNGIYDALTQCITKKEDFDDDTTDIEDNVLSPNIVPDKEIISDSKTNPQDNNPANKSVRQIIDDSPISVNEDHIDENMTQVVEKPSAVIDEENDENMTQIVEELQPDDNGGNVIPVVAEPNRDNVDNVRIGDSKHHVKRNDEEQDDDDVYNLATQVILTDRESEAKPVDEIPKSGDTSSISSNVEKILDFKQSPVANCEEDDIYNLATQVIESDMPSINTAKSSKISDVGADDIFMAATQIIPQSESLPSPISKMVHLSSENFMRETSIESRVACKRLDFMKIGSVDNFTFSTPNSGPIRKKKKIVHSSIVKEADVTMALRRLVPSHNAPPAILINDEFYNNTQELAADLMSSTVEETCVTPKQQEKDSPGKENSCVNSLQNLKNKQSSFYQNTQEILNDLCTQQTIEHNKHGSKDKDEEFYKSTQDVYNDLLTQDKVNTSANRELTKVSTPSKKATLDIHVAGTQLSESSEEIFKSPMKRKIKYTISDSELDSPQIDIFASKMLANFEVNSNSDYDDAPPEESQDTPVVFRKAIPLKKTKCNNAINNLSEQFDAPVPKVALRKNVKRSTKETEQHIDIGKIESRKRPLDSNDEDVIPKHNTRNQKRFILDSESTPESEEIAKVTAVTRNKKRFILDSDSTPDSEELRKETSKILDVQKMSKPSKSDAVPQTKEVKNETNKRMPRKGKNCQAAQESSVVSKDTDNKSAGHSEPLEIIGRRSSRVRKVNKKYEDTDNPFAIVTVENAHDVGNTGKRISSRGSRNSSLDHLSKEVTKKVSNNKSKSLNTSEPRKKESKEASYKDENMENVSNKTPENSKVEAQSSKAHTSKEQKNHNDDASSKDNFGCKPKVSSKETGTLRNSKPADDSLSIEKQHTSKHKAAKDNKAMEKVDKKKCDTSNDMKSSSDRKRTHSETAENNSRSSARISHESRKDVDQSGKCLTKIRSGSSSSSSHDNLSTSSKEKYAGIKVMITSLEAIAKSLEKTIERLGGRVVDKDAEVLVAPVPCKRTVKVMVAAAKGIPIVSQLWVATCQKAGQFVDPWNHILKCEVLETKYNICLDKVLRTARPYLKGWLVYVTPNVPMPFDQIKELVEVCGGNAELVPKSANRRSMKNSRGNVGTLSVSCAQDAQLWPILPEPVVGMELLLQGSFTHEVKINSYKLKKNLMYQSHS